MASKQISRQKTNSEPLFINLALIMSLLIAAQHMTATTNAMWLLQDLPSGVNSTVAKLLDRLPATTETNANANAAATAQVLEPVSQIIQQQEQQTQSSDYLQSMSPFSIAGIRPASIASLLNTVSDTGFSYFNVHDQCRSRTACDVGYMLYKKLNFIHNWIIRASVRTLVDSTNIYSIAWNNGMMGKNCTTTYPACSQSPLESLMNFALFAN